MTVKELAALLDGVVLTSGTDLDREVKCGYACDLLSWVMARGQEGMAWITVQAHMNVIAVASLADMSAIIAPEGVKYEQPVIDKAQEEGIAVISTKLSAYKIAGLMYANGIG